MPSPFPLAVAVGHQAPQSMGFPRQEHWSGLLFPSPGDLPDPGTEPASPALAGGFFTTRATWEALTIITYTISKQGVKLALLFIS